MSFLLADGNIVFAIALALMLIIAIAEGAFTVIGFGASQLLDQAMPSVDLDTDISTGNGLTKVLAWLRFGQVPALILLIVFLTCFALTGLAMQLLLNNTFGFMLPNAIAWIPALVVATPLVRASTGILAKVIIKDETESVSRDTFIGKVATITIGTAAPSSPAEAKLKDQFGTTHYVMVEPDEDARFEQGSNVLIVDQQGSTFKVIALSEI